MKTPCTVIFSALLLTCALGAAKAELDANDDIRDADYKTAHQKTAQLLHPPWIIPKRRGQ